MQYTYDPTHGGILTETMPAVNGINPVKRYSYVQRSAWILNGTGGYVKAASPVWLKNDERTCRTTATVSGACFGGSADEVVTTYQYGPDAGPNNLLLRGVAVSSNGMTRTTCYTYDSSGNKISETKPLGASGTCP
jgi:YD repeat-containing protein